MAESKKIIILIEDMFNVFEFWYPYYRLKEAGAEFISIELPEVDETPAIDSETESAQTDEQAEPEVESGELEISIEGDSPPPEEEPGSSVIRELRKLPDYRFTPLLMLTTEAGLDKKQEGKAAGATGWLVKPFDPAKLVEVIGKVIR